MSLDLTACWYRPNFYVKPSAWKAGYFHEWGLEALQCENGGTFSIGIVEDAKTGGILTVEPTNIHFGSDPYK